MKEKQLLEREIVELNISLDLMRKKYIQEDWYGKNRLENNAEIIKKKLNGLIDSYKKLLKSDNNETINKILDNLF